MRYTWMYWLVIGFDILGIAYNTWQQGTFNVINLVLLLNLILVIVVQRQLARSISDLLTHTGQKMGWRNRESALRAYISETGKFIDDVRLAISHFDQIGLQSFSDVITSVHNEEIKTTFLSTNDKIIEFRKKESENNWVSQGIAAISAIKHNGKDTKDYALRVISAVVKYMDASQGGFFLRQASGNDEYVEQIATYAYDKKKHVDKRVDAGEGLIGQALYEKEIIYLTDVPKDYVEITSGLGHSLPRCICICPLISEGIVYGVIEIASFSELGASQMEYLRQISQGIGYNLGAIESQLRTEALLNETRTMAEEVRSREEELRQNMEELTTTQEQMRRKQQEMDSVLASLSTVELDLGGNVLNVNPIFLRITGYQAEDVQGKPYKSLTPQQGNDLIQYDMMWSSIMLGRSFSGEFRIINREKKDMWMIGNFTPILDDQGKPYKVMVISLFTTQDKEKLFELQDMVNAFRGCFPIAEINPDLTFKTANDLFLTELGIKRIELKKSLLENILANGSYHELEQCLVNNVGQSDSVEISIRNKSGAIKRFSSSVIKVNGKNERNNKGVLILRNTI